MRNETEKHRTERKETLRRAPGVQWRFLPEGTMEPYQARVMAERVELDARLKNMLDLILSDEYSKMQEEDRMLLQEQYGHMNAYRTVLTKRLQRAGIVV